MRGGEVLDKLLHLRSRSICFLGALILAFFVFKRVLGRIVDKADLHGISDRRDKIIIRVFMHEAQKFDLILIVSVVMDFGINTAVTTTGWSDFE